MESARALLAACTIGDGDGAWRLLQEGADPTARTEFGATPLIRAAEQGHVVRSVQDTLHAGLAFDIRTAHTFTGSRISLAEARCYSRRARRQRRLGASLRMQANLCTQRTYRPVL